MAALSDGARRASLTTVAVVLGLLAFVATQYPGLLAVPFINDDFVFLDKTRTAGFLDLWGFRELAFHWYRPWSRELHYWLLQRLFGPHEPPFHMVSVVLWLAVLVTYGGLARRLSDARGAAVAVGAVAALAAWGVPILWVAGVQELWMLLFTLLTVRAWLAGQRGPATLALAAALMSKETAAVAGPLAGLAALTVGRRRPAAALREAWPLLAVLAVWALVHPVLGGRLWRPFDAPLEPGEGEPPLVQVVRTALVALNLDLLPRPERGWGAALVPGAIGAALLAAGVAWVARRAPPAPVPPATVRFGLLWALVGWAPLLMPSLGWHAYYALLGSLGVWLALAPLLARRIGVALAVIGALALLRPARADTPTLDWGSEWYQRRAAAFIRVMRGQLLAAHPRLPDHARLFFVRVPSHVGFLAGDGPALRVWYDEPTLRAGYYSAYRPRDPRDPPGPDLFFRFDSLGGWVEVVRGPEDVARARRANPRWEQDHATLAGTLARAGDWRGAAAEFEKLADAVPDRPGYAFDAALSHETLGDSSAAAAWYARAAALPDADEGARRAARRFARHLRGPRGGG